MNRARSLAGTGAACVAISALLAAAPTDDPAAAPGGASAPPRAAAPAADPPEAPARDGRRGDGRGEGGRWRPEAATSAEMAERVIAVARDVSPELAAEIEKARDVSPDRMSQSMRVNARRLMSLSVVKERNPELYAIRVEELRLQLELRSLGDQWRAATEAKDDAKAAALAARIETKARAQVDVDLKARAQELVALDAQLKSLRDELVDEQRRTADRVRERIEAVKSGQPLEPRRGGRGGQAGPAGAPPAGPPAGGAPPAP
ncbi:MAG: hypothetical protein FGM39_03395 [Phycisphaerales bacterium]|nr:hypothetical protein [Phycisphaerales bacterium]